MIWGGSLNLQLMPGLPGTFNIVPTGGLLLLPGWLLASAGFLCA